ncbi:MAG: hypothetical protein V2A79_05785 [Planctomycetota bacterium]
MRSLSLWIAILMACAGFAADRACAQMSMGTAFTYQGWLTQGGTPVNTNGISMSFELYDDAAAGTLLASDPPSGTVAVTVTDGLFTQVIDFGADVFTGEARWLQVYVNGSALVPRQELTPAPYALYALDSPGSVWESAGSDIFNTNLGNVLLSGRVSVGDETQLWGSLNVRGYEPASSPTYDPLVQFSATDGIIGNLYHRFSGTSSVVGLDSFAPNDPGTKVPLVLQEFGGNVGVGTNAPTDPLTVNGVVRSLAGGFKFPDGTTQTTAAAGSTGWSLTGNAGTNPTTNFLGTTDNQALEIRVNNARTLRIEPNATSPNILGGHPNNTVTAGAYGATIAGGGAAAGTNRVTDRYGTVGGGYNNQAGDGAGTQSDRMYATVAGGQSNTASGSNASVGGGVGNTASGSNSTVAGGDANSANGLRATIGGGWANAAGQDAFIGGGAANQATGTYANIVGGEMNNASALHATIGGGYWSEATGEYSTVSGGRSNDVTDDYGAVGGGRSNQAGDNAGTTADRPYATVGGGYSNLAKGSYSTIAGGNNNTADGLDATVSGGLNNNVTDDYGTIAGGGNNQAGDNAGSTADHRNATVGGGEYNIASGDHSTIAGGYINAADGTYATVAGGEHNIAADHYATVGGGTYNQAGDDIGTNGEHATVGGGATATWQMATTRRSPAATTTPPTHTHLSEAGGTTTRVA